MKVKLMFKNETIIEIIVKLKWKQELCIITKQFCKINYICSVLWYFCVS